jgi:4'-phosphopantetheinyl transferase
MPRPLGGDDVHIWVANSDALLPEPELLSDELSSDEVAHSRHLKFEADRRRFLATRLLRRRVLAEYLGDGPGKLTFRYGARGKPELASGLPGVLSFNESESDGLAVVAVARRRSLGVDIERIRLVPEAASIVSGFGSAREKDAFANMSRERQLDMFLRWWTGKEALVKALGDGLALPPPNMSVLLTVGGGVELADGAGWWLETLEPAPGYVGAVVAEGSRPQVSIRVWENSSA